MTKRILVIDDEVAIRKSFVLALEDTGYAVDTAGSGKEGIELFKNSQYDLIFLDMKMPGKNGVEVLREIRRMDQQVPIYIITAFFAEFFDELKNAEKEMVDFEILRKPIGIDQIVMVVKSVLESPVSY